jgi:hypothetical protein
MELRIKIAKLLRACCAECRRLAVKPERVVMALEAGTRNEKNRPDDLIVCAAAVQDTELCVVTRLTLIL